MNCEKIAGYNLCMGFKPIVEEGKRHSAFSGGGWNINYSSILTKLIQEAGRWCESFASDLFVDWTRIEEKLKKGGDINDIYLFGFRQSGVDHADWVESKGINSHEYRSVWVLSIDADIEVNKIVMELGRIN